MNITLNIIIENKNTGKTLYLQLLKEIENMKSDLFIRNLLIIIVILLALNIILPILSNPPTSYAAINIEYKVINLKRHIVDLPNDGKFYDAGPLEKLFNEYAKEGWEYIGSVSQDHLAIFKR